MSSISRSRSEPALWIVRANSICLRGEVRVRVVRQQPGQQQQRVERGAQLVAHVGQELRLVLADARRSCCAFSSRPRRASSISRFLISMLRFCSESWAAFSSSSALVRCSSRRLLLQLAAPGRWDCASSSSVRRLAWMVLSATPMVTTSRSRKVRCSSENGRHDAELDDAEQLALEQHRQHDHGARRAVSRPRPERAG